MWLSENNINYLKHKDYIEKGLRDGIVGSTTLAYKCRAKKNGMAYT